MAVRIRVLGGSGAFPTAEHACSGFLVEYEGFRVVVDMGYATFPQLLKHIKAESVDAVVISHGHPDHCADLNPLLRARYMSADPPEPLPVYSPPGALRAVLALDRPGMLDDSYRLHEFEPGAGFHIGPLQVDTLSLPHWIPNAGLRITAGDRIVAYTGDTGPSPDIVTLAQDADLFIAEATHLDEPNEFLSTPSQAGESARSAGVGRLMLTHLWPGSDPALMREAAAASYSGPIEIATTPGLSLSLGG